MGREADEMRAAAWQRLKNFIVTPDSSQRRSRYQSSCDGSTYLGVYIPGENCALYSTLVHVPLADLVRHVENQVRLSLFGRSGYGSPDSPECR